MSYSNKTHVILIKGVVRTTEVSLVKKDVGSTTTYLVYYKRPQEKGKGRLYQYPLKDVTILAHPEVLDPRTHDVFYQGNKLDNVYIVCRFKGDGLKYWTIGFADSREDLVCPDGIIITTPRMISGERSKSISRYLTWMAYLHGYDMRTDENIVLLGDQYDHLRRGQSTVHKFQGRQKDVIIISTVDNEYTNFTNDSNLFNVAVSRAKKQLILVTNGNENNSGTVKHLVDYIRESGGRSERGKVKSLFDLIYPQYESQYKKYISAHPQISQREYAGQDAPSPAERIAFCFITDVLKDYRGLIVRFRYPLHKLIPDTSGLDDEEEVRFVHNKDSHVDFMIFERKTMKPVLAIEIDGASYHIEGSFQGQRDKLKDGILEKYGIPMKRFRTKESINEVNILELLLLQIFHMPTHLLMTGIEGTVRD